MCFQGSPEGARTRIGLPTGKAITKGIDQIIHKVLPIPRKIQKSNGTEKDQDFQDKTNSGLVTITTKNPFAGLLSSVTGNGNNKRLSGDHYKAPRCPPVAVTQSADMQPHHTAESVPATNNHQFLRNNMQKKIDPPANDSPDNEIKNQDMRERPNEPKSPGVNVPPKLVIGSNKEDTKDIEDSPYGTLKDVPKNLSKISVKEVASCLELLHLSEYVESFVENQVDGDMMQSLTEEMLVEEFGMKRFQAVKLMKFFKTDWRPKVK